MKKKIIILPYNLLAEKIVLGSILTNSNSIDFVSQILPIEAFYLKTHQYIYKASLSLNANNKIVDLITVTSWLQDNNLIKKIGGLRTLNNLVEKIVSFINLKDYTILIHDKYIRRLLIEFGTEIIQFSYQTNFPLEKIFSKIEQKLFKLNQRKISNNLTTTGEILTEILLELKETDNEKTFSGYRSGFEDLNIMTQGFQKSDLIILAGRPSMGKTAFALNITLDLLLNYNNPIIFFSLEMPKSQLMYRLLSIDSEISTSRLKLGNLNDEEWQIINASIKKLSSLNLYIDDTSNISISEIRFKIQKIQAQFKNLGAVIVDYLQLLETSKKIENRVQEISKITRNLKGFAKEFNIPIIVLSQLSRNVESRKNKRPILSDLRESGCIHLKNSQIITYSRKLFYLISYENNKKNFQKTSSFIFKFSGLKPVFILKNDSKLPLYLTSNHKILSTNNWRRVDEINSLSFINSNLFLPIYNSKINSMIYQLIKKIRYIGLKDVYDLEISNSKTFFYNQFILHNSIEQDADIVLMLYRDEYYNEKSSEENIVELIIAKHRNGPVGTIKLLFDNYLTKFFNFS